MGVLGYSLASKSTQVYKSSSDLGLLRQAFDGSHVIIGHNISFDLHAAARLGIEIPENQVFIDTMSLAHLIDERQPLGLKTLALKYLGIETPTYGELSKQYSGVIPDDVLSAYAEKDARLTFDLAQRLIGLMSPKLRELYWLSESPNHKIIYEMEARGIAFNRELCQQYLAESQAKITALTAELHSTLEESGYRWVKKVAVKRSKNKVPYTVIIEKEMETNLASTDCLADILFRHYALKAPRLTKTGKAQVDDATLSILEGSTKKDAVSFITTLRSLREQAKLASTYYEPLLSLTTEGRAVRSNYNQTGTVTGRLSSSNPNGQNQPHSPAFRKLFVARPGCALLVADLNQAELRICAHVSQDKALLSAYQANADIHRQTADRLNVPRHIAKTSNFATLYRISASALRAKIKADTGQDIPLKDSEAIIAGWYETYAGVPKWQNEVVAFAHKNGYVESLFGRVRRLHDTINHPDKLVSMRAERQAINFMIQSVVGDIVKRAMAEFRRRVDPKRAWLLCQVHDELVVESTVEYAKEAARILKECMEGSSNLSVPIPAEVGIGPSWGEAKH